ncbi:MAG: HAD family hydrolase [Clostridia bacterium]|nr:HAD family hydrolase [Clostridia bacterium]
MLKAIFFDLDGTLLPMDEERFLEIYFGTMGRWMAEHKRDPEKFINGIIAGTRAMYKNDGVMTNEAVFWESFESVWGKTTPADREIMDGYYKSAYLETEAACGHNPYSKEIVTFCREAGLTVGLTTNPLFPRIATTTRMKYTGLSESDFDFITAYEDSFYTKPNPKYFTALLEKYSLSPNEVIIFGNNTYEDGECGLAAGIRCYIINSKDLIDSEKATHDFPHIEITDVIDTIKGHLK